MPPVPPPSIGSLLAKAVSDAKALATAQVALAKGELKDTGTKLTKGSILGLAALGLIVFGTFFLLFTLVYVLVQVGLPTWASFLIITALLFIGAAIALLLAKRTFESISGPTLAVEEFERTKQAFARGTAPAVAPDAGTAS